MRKKISTKKFLIKRLRRAEKRYKKSSPLVSQEARMAEEFINFPHSYNRFMNESPKALLDNPNAFKHKKIKRFLMSDIAMSMEIP